MNFQAILSCKYVVLEYPSVVLFASWGPQWLPNEIKIHLSVFPLSHKCLIAIIDSIVVIVPHAYDLRGLLLEHSIVRVKPCLIKSLLCKLFRHGTISDNYSLIIFNNKKSYSLLCEHCRCRRHRRARPRDAACSCLWSRRSHSSCRKCGNRTRRQDAGAQIPSRPAGSH